MFLIGVEHVGGDMFASIPKADAVFMKVHFINLVQYFLAFFLYVGVLSFNFDTLQIMFLLCIC